MQSDGSSWIVLAHLLRPQGRRGEVLADLLTDFPERFTERPQVFLAKPLFEGDVSQARSAEVVGSWLPVGKNRGRIVLHFAGINSISDAESIAGLDVVVPMEDRLPLEDDSVYVSDIIGCTVYDGITAIGVIEDVQFPTTPDGSARLEEAAPLLEVRSIEGEEVLIPFAKALLKKVDIARKTIEMVLPAGLLEINRTSGPKS
jgi:16S rRNA processing protein RimM